jgi:hypothetical protein
MMLYFALVRLKLEYASVARISVTIADPCTLESKLEKLAAVCHNMFFQEMEYYYDHLLGRLKLLTLHNKRRHFDTVLNKSF